MDNVERMFRHLVRVIQTRFPQYLTHPFDVAELYQNILPYRHNRRELGLETNEDYEITMLALLAGNHGYLHVEDRMREALQAELTSRNPDPGSFRQFPDAQITLSPSAVQGLGTTPSAPPRAARASAPNSAPARSHLSRRRRGGRPVGSLRQMVIAVVRAASRFPLGGPLPSVRTADRI